MALRQAWSVAPAAGLLRGVLAWTSSSWAMLSAALLYGLAGVAAAWVDLDAPDPGPAAGRRCAVGRRDRMGRCRRPRAVLAGVDLSGGRRRADPRVCRPGVVRVNGVG